jgi:hypothetical protein
LPAVKFDVIPTQSNNLRRPQAVPVSDQNGRGVPMAPTVLAGGVDKLLDLALGQILPRAVRNPPDCYILSLEHKKQRPCFP